MAQIYKKTGNLRGGLSPHKQDCVARDLRRICNLYSQLSIDQLVFALTKPHVRKSFDSDTVRLGSIERPRSKCFNLCRSPFAAPADEADTTFR